MAKIKPNELISTMSGKICMHSDTYFRTNAVTGKVTTGKMCHPSTAAPSSTQLAKQARFGVVAAAIRTRITALSATQKAAYIKEWKADGNYGSLFGYLFHKWNSEYNASGALISND